MDSKKKAIDSTKKWLTDFVIKLNLCPFAEREYQSNSIRFVVCDADQELSLLKALYDEINFLIAHSDISTTILIHPKLLSDFGDYNQFLDLIEGLLEQHSWLGEFQVASFHPDYLFAGAQVNDAENFTNRSPYPMLHILREEQVEKAVDAYTNIEQVPIRNIKLMQKIGASDLQSQLNVLIK